MCRHLAYLGPPTTLSALVLEPAHGLLRQSYAPRRQKRGVVNADGWGVGFHDDAGLVRRWRSSRPLWGEASFASLAPVLTSGSVLAAVRSATLGMPLDETAAAPFTDGTWLLSHNGRVSRAALPARLDAESTCDSAMLAAHVLAAGVDDVVARAPLDPVVPRPGDDAVVARPRVDHIDVAAADHGVVAGAGVDGRRDAQADGVVARAEVEPVGACGDEDDVGPRRAGDHTRGALARDGRHPLAVGRG